VTFLLHLEVVNTTHELVKTSQLRISGRKALVLSLNYRQLVFQGEACPLSGYGRDSFSLAENELRALNLPRLLGAIDEAVQCLLHGELSSVVPSKSCGSGLHTGASGVSRGVSSLESVWNMSREFSSPSARFCLEMLALEAIAQLSGNALPSLLHGGNRAPIYSLPTSAVVDIHVPDWLERMERATQKGVRTFKFKCGSGADETESRALRQTSERFGKSVNLRLDANRAWTVDDTLLFLERHQKIPLEFLEDPTSSPQEWDCLRASFPHLALAVDEPLSFCEETLICQDLSEDNLYEERRQFLLACHCQIAVLKPMALGGFSACLGWARAADSLGLRVCISHLFDGPLALDAATQLAFSIQSPELAPGLGEHVALAGYIAGGISEPRYCQGGRLHMNSKESIPNLR